MDSVTVKRKLETALKDFYSIEGIHKSINAEHVKDTPKRIVESMLEMYEGCWINPESVLERSFKETKYDEMIYVNDISFVSMCAHHGIPFFGKAHFGYIPAGKIIGLSKIPRLINTYAKRPQVQEKLTQEIVDTFMKVLKPKGCGLVIEAWHLCMMVRGVKQTPAYTKTTALRGNFKGKGRNTSTKMEFLNGVKQSSRQIWP